MYPLNAPILQKHNTKNQYYNKLPLAIIFQGFNHHPFSTKVLFEIVNPFYVEGIKFMHNIAKEI
jgi:hypothetical protein